MLKDIIKNKNKLVEKSNTYALYILCMSLLFIRDFIFVYMKKDRYSCALQKLYENMLLGVDGTNFGGLM